MSKIQDIPEAQKLTLNSLNKVWPLYHGNEVAIGKIDSPLAITTLWTERQSLEKLLNKNEFCAIGQCFSPRGVSLILRELLANPNIRQLVAWGRDSTNTGKQLKTFFEKGFNEDYTLHGFGPSIKLHEEIPREELNQIRTNVQYIDLSNIGGGNYSEAMTKIKSIHPSKEGPWRDYGIQYPLTITKPSTMPGEIIGYQAKGWTVEETWLNILDLILRFGKIKEIPGEDFKKDISSLMAIIEGPETHKNMENPKVFRYIPEFEKAVETYVHQFTSDSRLEGSAYSYGEELFAHQAHNKKINQVDYIIKKLSGNQHTGRAFASSWNVGRHMEADETPCLVDVQFATVQSGENENQYSLLLTSHFKTHDMFGGWPANAFGLRELQTYVLDKLQTPFSKKNLNLSLGPLVTLSGSAHIYGGQIENAEQTLKDFPLVDNKHYNLSGKLHQDPRGNYKITLNGEKINIEHYNLVSGEVLESEEFKTIRQAQRWIANERFSDSMHGVYLGAEIEKAGVVLQLRRQGIEINYVQDKKLNFKSLKTNS